MISVPAHPLRRGVLTGLVCFACYAVLSLGASAAHAALSGMDHNCDDVAYANCGTRFFGAGVNQPNQNNVMIAEPAATAGKVKFTEASTQGQINVLDAGGAPFEECTQGADTTTAECPVATGTGFSRVEGIGGNDTVTLKPGANGVRQVTGGPGADTLNTRDGNVQTEGIDCGADGGDVANIDANDPTPVGCETVNRTGGAVGGNPKPTTPAKDTTGPAFAAPSEGDAIAAARTGGFGFELGPFREDTTGTVAIKSAPVVARVSAKRRKRKKVVLNLGTKSFSAKAGKKATVRFKLSRKARRILAKRKRIKMSAAVTARDKAGNVTKKTYKFTVKAPKKKRKRSRR